MKILRTMQPTKKRVDAATKLYEEFYATNREKMSTHFRMLYQLVHFISNAQYIDNEMKVKLRKSHQRKHE